MCEGVELDVVLSIKYSYLIQAVSAGFVGVLSWMSSGGLGLSQVTKDEGSHYHQDDI